MKVWVNGKIKENYKIPITSPSIHYGVSAFEGIRFYYSQKHKKRFIFRLKEHVDRLFYSIKVLGVGNFHINKEQVFDGIKEIVKIADYNEGYIRPIFYFLEGLGLQNIRNPELSIFTLPWDKYLEKEMVDIKIVDLIKLHPFSVDLRAKLGGYYINSVLASLRRENKDEVLLLDYRGFIAEGPGENIFIIKDNQLITPKSDFILAGITRDSVITIAKEEGLKVIERDISKEELFNADEAFFCGT